MISWLEWPSNALTGYFVVCHAICIALLSAFGKLLHPLVDISYTQGSTSITSKACSFSIFLMLACACICCITGWLCLLTCYTILSLRSPFVLHTPRLTQQTRLAATFLPLCSSHYAFIRRAIN